MFNSGKIKDLEEQLAASIKKEELYKQIILQAAVLVENGENFMAQKSSQSQRLQAAAMVIEKLKEFFSHVHTKEKE